MDTYGTIQLTPRLEAVAEFVPQGAQVADVGTDHAYLPVRLLQSGKVTSVIASDIGEGPLQSARRTAAKYGLENKMRFLRADGLSYLCEGAVDTVVIAGMGGETIADILAAAPADIRGLRLLLQPMTRVPELCDWLEKNGFAVTRAKLVREGETLYLVLEALYTPHAPIKKAERWVPGALRGDPLLPDYLALILRRMQLVGRGLATAREPDMERLQKLEAIIGALQHMKEETV